MIEIPVIRVNISFRTGLFATLVPCLLFIGCSNLRYLEEHQVLYTGANIEIESQDRIRDKSLIESELEDVITPEPNQTILGLRPWLWIYNVAGEPTGRGLRYFMRNRIGEPPVLVTDVDPQRTRRLMVNRLVNLGYFDGQVSFDISERNQRATYDYLVTVREPYRLLRLHPMEGDTGVAQHINEAFERTILGEGHPYRLQTLRQERERIDAELKERGYFYFNPDVILFRADTMAGEREVELYPIIKPDVPAIATRQYSIRNVYVYADYLMDGQQANAPRDTIVLDEGLYLFDSQNEYRERVIDGAILLRQGELYRLEDHNRTLNYLTNLGVFRFVNMRFVPVEQNGQHSLDVRVLLTPMDKKSISAEVRGVTKSNNFAGPGVLLSFTNRNFLGGAEDFRFSTNASWETLMGGGETPASSWELGGEVQLSYPRFVLPFGIRRPQRVFTPRTNITLGINYLNRTDAFELTSLNFSYGYNWNRTAYIHHRLVPLVVNVFSLGRVHDESVAEVVQNVFLRQALFEQFILGAEYSFIYNTQLMGGQRPNDYFFNMNLDSSGNLAWLLTNLASDDDNERQTILGESFAQYFRPDVDVRYYRRLSGSTRLATRLIVGAGFPYGNSDRLPYLKQFVIGGTNSIRAFHPRTLGPGAYASPDTLAGRFNIHQAGELKLEANVEYRFDITNIFKGALFVDAGNVWRLQEDENTPGGMFSTDTFLEQIALGTGAGLRIDVGFFVLRLDFAFPLAVPYSGRPGYFDPVRPFRDMVFNLGIGYPY